jgi:hypothetical protein
MVVTKIIAAIVKQRTKGGRQRAGRLRSRRFDGEESMLGKEEVVNKPRPFGNSFRPNGRAKEVWPLTSGAAH